jgi:hypothetical protein
MIPFQRQKRYQELKEIKDLEIKITGELGGFGGRKVRKQVWQAKELNINNKIEDKRKKRWLVEAFILR